MPAWPRCVWSTTISNATLGQNVETIAATISSGVFSDHVGQPILLLGYAEFTAAAATTNVRARLRRGATITDTLVTASDNIAATASVAASRFMMAVDTPTGELAAQSYVLTLLTTAAGATGTIDNVSLAAFLLAS